MFFTSVAQQWVVFHTLGTVIDWTHRVDCVTKIMTELVKLLFVLPFLKLSQQRKPGWIINTKNRVRWEPNKRKQSVLQYIDGGIFSDLRVEFTPVLLTVREELCIAFFPSCPNLPKNV